MQKEMIKFENVSFSYGDRRVIKDMSFVVSEGESVCFFGPSGCGKSTIMKLICGLEKPLEGSVTVSAGRIRPMFQQDRLLPFKTVRENIEMFADGADVTDITDALGISRSAGKYPANLSGGMARRTALARAIAGKGDLYIFDEPFNGLDDENTDKAMELIKERTKGVTCVFILHSREYAERLGCRIMEMP